MTDAHCHLGTGLGNPEIVRIINGTDVESSQQAAELAIKHKNVWVCVGIHPEEAGKFSDSPRLVLKELKRLAGNNKVVGIGEIGLDYRQGITEEEKSRQKIIFSEMVNLAVELQLPVVIHNRNADEDIQAAISAQGQKLKGVLMHCFTRNLEFMEKIIPLGAYFSFGGFVINKKNTRIRKAVRAAPVERLLLETDAPYGNADVKIVAEEVAYLTGITMKKLETITDANAKKLFKKMI